MNTKRLTITVWHGEARSLFYVVDADAPHDEQPAVVVSCHSREEAEAYRDACAHQEACDDE